MSYSTIPYYKNLSSYEMANAPHLSMYAYDFAGYENAVQFTANYAGAAGHAVFSFNAVAGAVYSLQSGSYRDPGTMLVFDDDGYAIAEDDHTGNLGGDHITFVAPYSGTYYVDASWWQGSGNDQQAVSLTIYEDLGTLTGTVINGSAQSEKIDGTSGNDNLYGRGGADSLFGGRGDDYLDGGTGLDEAYYNGNRAEYSVRAFGDRFTVTDLVGGDGKDLLSNVERLNFKDGRVALDVDGAAGEAYRLYQAAFNRVPDKSGLGYWIDRMDHGASLDAIAGGFVGSTEFRSVYGAQPGNADIVARFYQNVLHRAPDQAGLDYWVNVLNTKAATVAEVLVGFSESNENYTQLIGTMSNGIEYQPWG